VETCKATNPALIKTTYSRGSVARIDVLSWVRLDPNWGGDHVRSKSTLRKATVVLGAALIAVLVFASTSSAAAEPKPAGTEFRLTGDDAK
jgi:hypothetical protein